MSSFIHAQVTIAGDASLLEACDARIRALLDEQAVVGEVEAQHGIGVLRYDLKVRGGIPFPAFAAASQAFPMLRIDIEWIDVEAGARGSASIADGRLAAHSADRLETAAAAAHRVYVSVDEAGRLRLALTFVRSDRDEWLGYALTADRDALLRVRRAESDGATELVATEGAAEWSLRWRAGAARGEYRGEPLDPPQPIDADTFRELEALAEAFVGDWIWLAAQPEAAIAIERERYAQADIAVQPANVKFARLHRLRAGAEVAGGTLSYSTLEAEEDWIRDCVARCWAERRV